MAIHLILSCKPGEFATVWATVCSSWVHMNCYTSCRSVLLPEGDQGKSYIRQANTMVSRILPMQKEIMMCNSNNTFLMMISVSGMIMMDSFVHEIVLRCVLLLALTTCCGGSWLLEQPRSSVMGEFFRFQFLCDVTKEA